MSDGNKLRAKRDDGRSHNENIDTPGSGFLLLDVALFAGLPLQALNKQTACLLSSFPLRFRLFAFRASIWTCTGMNWCVLPRVCGHKLLTISDTLSLSLFIFFYWYQNVSLFLLLCHYWRFDAACGGVGQWGRRSRPRRCRFVRHSRWRRRNGSG